MKDRRNLGLEDRRVGRKSEGDSVVKVRALKDRVPGANTIVGLGAVSINVELTELSEFRGSCKAIAHYSKKQKRGSDSDAVSDRREVCLVPKVDPEFAVGFAVFCGVRQTVPCKMSEDWITAQSSQGRLL